MKKTPIKLMSFSVMALVLFCSLIGLLFGRELGYVTTRQTPFLDKMLALFNKYTSVASERVYMQTDKPLYMPGETIWFQVYAVNTKDSKPSEQSDIIHVQLINPKGGIEQEMKIILDKGSAGGDFNLNSSIAGGLYKLKAYTSWQYNEKDILTFEKEIQIQQVILPRLKMKLDFEKKAYGPGDEVKAKVEFTSLANKPLSRQPVNFILNLDGQKFFSGKDKTDADGIVNVKVKLPKDLKTNDGLLGVLIEHEGRTESITRSVPIVLNKIDLSFYPEGGDMVANLESRVAFKAINEFNKPADIEGYLEDDLGNKITTFSSYHFGMGSFNMKPVPGRQYHVKIIRPEGINETYQLPAAIIAGYTLQIPSINNGNSLNVVVNSTLKEELSIIVSERDKIYYEGAFDANPGENIVNLPLNKFPMGITQITLFDSKGTPRAERLVFVNKKKGLKISISTDKQKYQPREKVEMNIKTTDENGNPVPANLSLAVVDDKLLSFADDRSGTILSKLFLEPELKEKVEESAFYFDPKEPKADTALDYLLLTSGWRRFTWKQLIGGETRNLISVSEKADIQGIVRDAETDKPLPNKKVALTGAGSEMISHTNSKGVYHFKLKEMTGPVVAHVKDTAYADNGLNITQFGENYNINIESKEYLRAEAKKEKVIIQAYRGQLNVDNTTTGQAMTMVEYDKVAHESVNTITVRGSRGSGMFYKPGPDVIPDPKIEKEPAAVQVNGKVKANLAMDSQIVQINNFYFYRTRQFPAPKYKTRHNTDERTDFRSTIYWKGGIETNSDGEAKVHFYNSDDVTAFRATVEGIGGGMAGHSEMVYYTQLPFSISAKIPNGAASGDEVNLPIYLTNNTSEIIKGNLNIKTPRSWKASSSIKSETEIEANSTKAIFINYKIMNLPGKDTIQISFNSLGQNDNISQEVNTSERGFPEEISFSGEDKDKTYSFEVGSPLEGTLHADITAYPSSLSETMKGLDAILREPSGCFEQTSSSNYPNIIALMYMKETGDINDKIKKRALDLLDAGYKRLVTFETPNKGYEWFGSSPGHEALTAYGLMEFNDMKEVYASVDKGMIDRTANWLMNRKDNKGGFARSAEAIDNFGRASDEVTNAYIVYAMSEGGYKDIIAQIDAALLHASQSGDPYELGLVANALCDQGDVRAQKAIEQLISKQQSDGSWIGKQSITCSGGKALIIETTSIVAMAMMKQKIPDHKALENAIKYIIAARDGSGGWGNTQTTVLALKALTRYSKYSKHTQESGAIAIYVDGKKVETKNYEAGEKDEIKLAGLENYLTVGKHNLSVKFAGTKYPLPYTTSIKWRNINPGSDDKCKLKLTTTLSNKEVKTGETVRLSAVLKNVTNSGQPMSIAILGIPAGLSAQPWQLKELQEKGVYDFYEIKGNNVVVYYRQMKPAETKTINLDLKAEIPGNFEAPASSAYLYYTSEDKSWCKAEGIVVR